MKLARIKNSQFEEIEEKAQMTGIPLSQCPTCGSKPFRVRSTVPDEGEAEGFINGTYRYRGEEHPCDCDTQRTLRKHYLLANIGDQYMKLDWDDYGNEAVKTDVAFYLDRWPGFKANGMGIEFGGSLGVGKTFSATYVGKELIKRGERVYFMPFMDVLRLFQRPIEIQERLEQRLREVTVLILDEVIPPRSEKQHGFYGDGLEALIRHRTNFNLPTIITTNVTERELLKHYPRTYSLLHAKQMRVDITGEDARQGWIGIENMELAANGEVRPIT